MRVWLAEGVVKPGPLLPAVSLQAVAVIRCNPARDSSGRPIIHHQGEVYMHTDSKAVAVATELLGQSAQELAAQAVSQMELFFSAIIWYLDRHPERTELLLAAGLPAGSSAGQEVRRLLPPPSRAAAPEAGPKRPAVASPYNGT
jgi:hypothetical protein